MLEHYISTHPVVRVVTQTLQATRGTARGLVDLRFATITDTTGLSTNNVITCAGCATSAITKPQLSIDVSFGTLTKLEVDINWERECEKKYQKGTIL